MRWTTGNEQIHRDDRRGAIADLGVVHKWTPGDGAGPDGDNDLGLRDGIVSLLQRQFHVAADRAGDEKSVGMARRRHELDAESAKVPADRAQNVRVRFACVSPTRADLAQAQGSAE